MFSFGNPDSKFAQGMETFSNAVWLTILMVLTSIPLITIGAAISAAHDAARRVENAEGHMTSAYFRAFASNFLKSTAIWIVMGPLLALILWAWIAVRIPPLLIPQFAIVSSMMETSIMAAHDAIVGKAKRERRLAGMGTTVTAVTLVCGYWVLAHLGDSRAYLLRDNHLMRMTTDHSYVQHLIDTGHITPEEARNHPQRNVVMRVLGDFDIDPRPDIALRQAHPSDRWLLCSDGLCGVLEDTTIQDVDRKSVV